MNDTKCPYCGKKYVVKRGLRKSRFGKKQLYFCKLCRRKFVDRSFRHRTYSPRVIYHSLISYNLGNTLEQTSKLVNRRFKVRTSPSTIHTWIKEFRQLCPISAARKQFLNGIEEPLVSSTFIHQELEYRFLCHLGKLRAAETSFPSLAGYVRQFEKGCPDAFFKAGSRCSQPIFTVRAPVRKERNLACEMAGFAVKAARTNYERHGLVENFFLASDLATIACEVPVWYWEKSVDIGVTGHIDILQVRNGLVYIMDYKPLAHKEKSAHRQLYHYASALSFRAGVPMKQIRCAWFDSNSYYEYSPSEAEVKLVRSGSV
jgi:transposase-like protein